MRLRTAIATLAAACSVAAQTDPGVLARDAQRAMSERRFSDAADSYGQLAKQFPGEPALQANLGMALHLSGRDREALEPLRSAARAMPYSFPAHFFLGASLTRIGDLRGAVEPLRKAVALDLKHPYARALLGDALEAADRFSEAAESWEALRGIDPENPFAHAGLVRCHEQLASRAVDALQARAPESAYMFRLLGRARLAAGQYPSALYLFRQALERDPGSRAVREAVAEVYERSGHAAWAEQELQAARGLPARDCASLASLACRFASGSFDSVPTLSADAAPDAIFWTARMHATIADRAFASLSALPESVDQLRLAADLLASQQRYSEAADACQRALRLRAGDGMLERQLAELLYLARRADEARPLLNKFRSADPRDPRWPAMLGNLLAEEQDYEAAVPMLEAAVALPGAPPMAGLDLGRSYLAIGQPADAVSHLQAAATVDTDGSLHYQLAQAYQRLGKREDARQALERYQELVALSQQSIEASAALEITAPE